MNTVPTAVLLFGATLLCSSCSPLQSLDLCDTSIQQGQNRCLGKVLQTCQSGRWVDVVDCGAMQKTCGTLSARAALHGCLTPSVLLPPCTFEGHTPAHSFGFYDPEIVPLAVLVTTDAQTTAAVTEILQVFNYPDLASGVAPGATAVVSFAGVNADFGTCGFCLFAFKDDVPYLGVSGTANVKAPATGSDTFQVQLSDVAMVEIAASGEIQRRGRRWCIDDLYLSATMGPWRCSEFDDAVQDGSFEDGQRICQDAPQGQYDIIECVDGAAQKVDDCDDADLVCCSEDNPAAACREGPLQSACTK